MTSPPASGQLAADPARGPGHEDALALDRLGEAALAEQVRIEVALPVVPELGRVARERRDRDPRPPQRALRVACVEIGVEVAVLERGRRDVQVAEHGLADLLHGRDRLQPGRDRLGDHVGEVGVDPHRKPRRVRRLCELVEDLAHAERLRVDQVEGVAVDVLGGQVGDVVHRARDEVDRHDVDLLPLRARQREPLGQRVAQPLEQLEEVIGPVDLVHLAGARVADDDPRPVHAQRRLDLLAHELLRLELRAVVGVRELLALIEHVLAVETLELPRDRDRARVVEAAHVDRVRELDDVARAVDVRPRHALLVGRHVVDRGEVEEVVDRLAEPVDAEALLREVADDRYEAIAGAQLVTQLVEPAARSLPHQGVDRPVASQQLLDEMTPDEAGRAGHEIVHRTCLHAGARVYP